MNITISINHDQCIYEAGLKIACLAEAADLPSVTVNDDLMQQYWEECCRDADIMLSRYRVACCQPELCGNYLAVLRMPHTFDAGLAPTVSALLFSYFMAFIAAASVSYIAPLADTLTAAVAQNKGKSGDSFQKAIDALRMETSQLRERVIKILNLRRCPIRRRMTFS